MVINTHKPLYQYNWLPVGVASATSIFQKTMEGILQGIEHVTVYIDDILVTGRTEPKHLQTLQDVLACLEKAGGMVEEEQVCLHVVISGLPRTQDINRRTVPHRREGQSD